MEIKLNYKNKLKIINLILGFVWLGLGSSRMIFDDDFGWVSYAYIVLGTVYWGLFYFQNKGNYILVKEGWIEVRADFGCSKMKLTDIKSIRKFAGDFKLISDNDEIVISPQALDDIAFEKLKKVLEELDVVWR